MTDRLHLALRDTVDRALASPRRALALALLLCAALGTGWPRLTLDVSAERLLAAPPAARAAQAEVAARFHVPDTLRVVVLPTDALLAPPTLALIDRLAGRLAAVPGVARVTSILDLPLVTVVPGPLAAVADNTRTLRAPGVDPAAALRELTTSPLYASEFVSVDGRRCALLVELAAAGGSRTAVVDAIDAVLAEFRPDTRAIAVGGAAALAAKVEDDIVTDRYRVPALVMLAMGTIIAVGARRLPWLELGCGALALGLLGGAWGWIGPTLAATPAAALPLTVVLATSLALRLVGGFEFHRGHDTPVALAARRALATTARTSAPGSAILAAVATTALLSPLAPLHELGLALLSVLVAAWTSSCGVGVLLLAAVPRRIRPLLPLSLAPAATEWRALFAFTLAVVAATGMPRYLGAASIAAYLPGGSAESHAVTIADRHFGGAFELDVVVPLPATPTERATGLDPALAPAGGGNLADDWFTAARIDRIKAAHRWLVAQSGVGKVQSFATLLEVGRTLNGGDELAPFDLNVMYKRLPAQVRVAMVDPYLALAANEARFRVRLPAQASGSTLQAVVHAIDRDLAGALGLENGAVRVVGPAAHNARLQDFLPPSLLVLSMIGGLGCVGMLALRYGAPPASLSLMIPILLAAAAMFGLAGWRGVRLDALGTCAAAVACALFVHMLAVGGSSLAGRAEYAHVAGAAGNADPGRALNAMTVLAGVVALRGAAFPPTAHFGMMLAGTLMLALLMLGRSAQPHGTTRAVDD